MCRRQVDGKRHKCMKSIRKGSFFEHSNLQLEEMVQIVYFWCKNIDYEFLKSELNMQNDAITNIVKRCREICHTVVMMNSEMIGGENVNVEIDESKIGKRKYNRGKRVEGQWVFGGCETTNSNKIFVVPVQDRSKETLQREIKKWIKPGSVIVSDCWKGYIGLEDIGYTHKTVNHSIEFKNDEGYYTNTIEGSW